MIKKYVCKRQIDELFKMNIHEDRKFLFNRLHIGIYIDIYVFQFLTSHFLLKKNYTKNDVARHHDDPQ